MPIYNFIFHHLTSEFRGSPLRIAVTVRLDKCYVTATEIMR
jgi:hypothetical protein